MTRRNFVLVAILIATGLALGACRNAPIYNVQETTLATRSDNVTIDQVGDAIVRAGASLGWVVVEDSPGHMVGTLDVRSHHAVVDIRYTTETFNIAYRDSSNLLYDGSSIHSRYNTWVKNLERAIQSEAVSL
jgi:hypothetical protein